MSAISWTSVEDAIQAFVAAASGLPGKLCRWWYQATGADRPRGQYISLQLDGLDSVSRDWIVTDDAPEPDPEPGQELRRRARGQRTMTLALEAFCAADGALDTPLKLLADVVGALELYVYDLDEGGVGIGDVGPVRIIKGSSQILDPRARVEITVHLASEVESRLGYIQYVQTRITETTTGDETEVWTPDVPPES